jgi:hypothetical protein
MFGERRKHPRYVINRVAKFQADSGAIPRDCTITDISAQGARLFSEGEIPDQFFLLIYGGDKVVREECSVTWRLGGEVGVTFVTHRREILRAQLIDRLRAETRQAFHRA